MFSSCRFLQLFLQLLYCPDVLLLVANWPFCTNKFELYGRLGSTLYHDGVMRVIPSSD